MRIDLRAIYVLWLRDMKRFFRAKSRLVGSLGMPLFFLMFMGSGFSRVRFPGAEGVDYMNYLTPGIVGMVLLFGSMFAGISVLWDRQFGFLKEIMVTPVSRVSIVLGRTMGGVSMAMMQGLLMLGMAIVLGAEISGIAGLLLSLVFMVLISATFVGLGLAFASVMEDMHGFQLIMNFLIFPLFFLSGALFPLDELPSWVTRLAYLDPLTYGVDGLRGGLIGAAHFPLALDLAVLVGSSMAMLALGTYLFGKVEV